VIEHEDRVEARFHDGSYFCFPRRDVLILDLPNTSTEMLARYLALRIVQALPIKFPDARLHSLTVAVEESPGQAGVYRIRLPG
jgi:hypothetical protein